MSSRWKERVGASKPSLCIASTAKNNNQCSASVVVTDYFSQVLFPTAEWKDELAANLLKHFKVYFFLPLHQHHHHQNPKAFWRSVRQPHAGGGGNTAPTGGTFVPNRECALFLIHQLLVSTYRYWPTRCLDPCGSASTSWLSITPRIAQNLNIAITKLSWKQLKTIKCD